MQVKIQARSEQCTAMLATCFNFNKINLSRLCCRTFKACEVEKTSTMHDPKGDDDERIIVELLRTWHRRGRLKQAKAQASPNQCCCCCVQEAESIGVVDYPRPKSLARTLMDRWSHMQANSGSQPASLSVLFAAALASCGFSPQADPFLHAAKNVPGSAELLDGL